MVKEEKQNVKGIIRSKDIIRDEDINSGLINN
jgi:hypothetical protein